MPDPHVTVIIDSPPIVGPTTMPDPHTKVIIDSPPKVGPTTMPDPQATVIIDMPKAWLVLSQISYNMVFAVPTVPEQMLNSFYKDIVLGQNSMIFCFW